VSVLQIPYRLEFYNLLLCRDVLQHLATDGSDVNALKTQLALGRDGARSVEIAHAVYRISQNGVSVPLDDSMGLSETKSKKLSVG
jgi:hypothetical protein